MNIFSRCILFALAGLLVTQAAWGQADPNATKYWIYFSDRSESAAPARHVVSPKALARRALRGSAVPSSIDYHISQDHIDALQNLGVRPIVESRWINAVSAMLTEKQYGAVRELDGVIHLVPVAGGIRERSRTGGSMFAPSTPVASDFATAPSLPDAASLASLDANREAQVIDYGPSEGQLALVNAIPPLEAGFNGEGVVLGFLDASFLEFNHPSLQHLHVSGRAEIMDFTERQQGGSHGLSVVSVAAAYAPGSLIGPAYGAHVLGATTEYAPTETNAEEDYFVAGLEWLEAMGADIVSASIGYTTFDPGQEDYSPEDLDGNTAVTTRAADLAAALGVTFVAAAGNDGCSSPDLCWYYVGTPADGDSVIAVGAATSSRLRSSFSSFGPTADGRIKPDVAALGTGVYLAIPNGEYAYSQGTSFAAPMVAGVVAQMLQANPSLTPMEIRDILRQTADQADHPDNALGWGVVNAAASVQVAVDLSTDDAPSSDALVVQVYPNPATDYLFIHINAGSKQPPRVSVYDVLGRSVDPQNAEVDYPSLNLLSLNTANLPAGLYFVVVEADGMRAGGSFVVVR